MRKEKKRKIVRREKKDKKREKLIIVVGAISGASCTILASFVHGYYTNKASELEKIKQQAPITKDQNIDNIVEAFRKGYFPVTGLPTDLIVREDMEGLLHSLVAPGNGKA